MDNRNRALGVTSERPCQLPGDGEKCGLDHRVMVSGKVQLYLEDRVCRSVWDTSKEKSQS